MADFAQATVEKGLRVVHGSDDSLLVKFYPHPLKDVPYVQINIPGDKTTEIHRKATDKDKERWPRQWDAFQKGAEQRADGTTLETWGILTQSMIDNYRSKNIHTVEALASVNDQVLPALGMGAFQAREKARQFVSRDQGAERAEALAKENADLKARLAALEERMTQVEAPKPKRGRPKKESVN